MTRTTGERKLIAFLNLPDLTFEQIDRAFEEEGKDIGSRLGGRILEFRSGRGPFRDASTVRAVTGIGPARLALMVRMAEAGALDPLLPPSVVAPPLSFLPAAVQRMGEALIGATCTPLHLRLERTALAAFAVSTDLPKLAPAGAEFSAAAEALRQGRPSPSLDTLAAVLQIPVSKKFLTAIPIELRDDWRLLDSQLRLFNESMDRFRAATWIDALGPTRSADLIRFVRGDSVASAVAGLAPSACRIAGAALLDGGVLLLGAAEQLTLLMEPVILSLLGFCEDACTLGDTRNCEATDVVFAPKGRDSTDEADFQNSIRFLTVFSYAIPGKYLSPGGKTLIREITAGLAKIKDAKDKQLAQLGGYSVFVRLEFEECVSGLCGNYWKKKSRVVEIDPPPGKQNTIGTGWQKSLIEGLGNDERATARQLEEFKSLAERQCP
ncbi:MAG TPA: hypothetical protein VMN36_02460 [Verrucomicrobiales bacterium]|nr:hypothetical protein [Verrucomicrobiales bacterium]